MHTALERRQGILDVLNSRRFDKIENLSNEFNVSRSTIKRDIEILSLTYPITTIQGNGGGVKMFDGCYLDRKHFTQEQEMLLEKLLPSLNIDDQKTMIKILNTFAVSNKKRRVDTNVKDSKESS